MKTFRIAAWVSALALLSVGCGTGIDEEPLGTTEDALRGRRLRGCKKNPCAAVRCAAGTHCEAVEVQCITAPCCPVAQCVADNPCPEGKAWDATTGQCVCTSIGLCVSGSTWDPEACQCVSPCATVLCAPGTHCEVVDGAASCVADQPAPCVRTGCSGQICSDQEVFTTCEWREEYACYRSATCERQADGTCGWTMTPELQACLAGSAL